MDLVRQGNEDAINKNPYSLKAVFWDNVFTYCEEHHLMNILKEELQGRYYEAKNGRANITLDKVESLTGALDVDWWEFF